MRARTASYGLALAFALALPAEGHCEPIVISSAEDRPMWGPVAGALPDGGWVLAWDTMVPGSLGQVRIRFLNADGAPRGDEQIVATGFLALAVRAPRLAIANDGTVLVALKYQRYNYTSIAVRRYRPDGVPLDGEAAAVLAPYLTLTLGHDVTALPGGGWLLVADVAPIDGSAPNEIDGLRLSSAGSLVEGPFRISPDDAEARTQPAVAIGGEGLVAAWIRGRAVVMRTLDANGHAVGPERLLGLGEDSEAYEGPPVLAASEGGSVAAIWPVNNYATGAGQLRGRRIVDGAPVGNVQTQRSFHAFAQNRPALAADRFGRFLVGVSESTTPSGPSRTQLVVQAFGREGAALTAERVLLDSEGAGLPAPAAAVQPDGEQLFAWAEQTTIPSRILADRAHLANGCASSATALCLTGARFRVAATWEDGRGNHGSGQAVPLTGESGAFWFFSPGNLELIVKVLDACGAPEFHDYWVFAAGLTDVAVELVVTDTETGETWRHASPYGTPFQPVQDTSALATCP